jgi:hypothetical protein
VDVDAEIPDSTLQWVAGCGVGAHSVNRQVATSSVKSSISAEIHEHSVLLIDIKTPAARACPTGPTLPTHPGGTWGVLWFN